MAVGDRFGRPVRLACSFFALVIATCACSPTPSPAGVSGSAAASDQPAAPALPGWFAFTGRDGDLWVMRGDGSGRLQVTQPEGSVDFSPTWAPDASRLAFRSSTQPAGGAPSVDTIRIVNADGTAVRDLVEGSFPAWSPDGASIAFRGIDGVDLALIKPDGTGLRPLGVRNAECPVWSPDGSKLLYCRNEDSAGHVSNNWDVWVMKADGSDSRQLTNDPARDYPIAWSTDGSKVIVFSDREGRGASYLMASDGSEFTRITPSPDLSSVNVWLPDGRFVIAGSGADAPDWYVLDANGARQLIPQLAGAFDPLAWIEGS